MGDWLLSIARWLEVNVIALPFYFAAPAMIIIGALDSSLLSLPEINDYLVVGRCFRDHNAVYYFPLFAATGSVLGCNLLYTIIRRGGQGVLRKRFNLASI
jgi:membrane protein DedA with SNARE-associated domain